MAETGVSVFDFPQVWQKPAFGDLLSCLKSLHIQPPVWNAAVTSRKAIFDDLENTAQARRQVTSYLSNIIKSGLDWIEDDDAKEALWTEASRCLSERCGRAGMGEITRRWPFESQGYPGFDLTIREPPIVGDCLGFKTWGSSYLLARLLDKVVSKSMPGVLSLGLTRDPPLIALELGSGTGLLGLAAAAIWKTNVVLSDLPDIMSNLEFNIEKNRSTIEAMGGSVASGALTWGGSGDDDAEIFSRKNQFKIVLVADALYDDDHPELLASAVLDHLAMDKDARLVMMGPMRDATTRRLVGNFRTFIGESDSGLECLEEHSILGEDDWGDAEESHSIECWWGIFGRKQFV